MKSKQKLIKMVIIICLSLYFLSLAGCSVTYIVLDFGRIRGVVTDSITGLPIRGVYVEAYDFYDYAYDYTNANGEYYLDLEAGFYDVRFQKRDYYPVVFHNIGVIAPFTRWLDVSLDPSPFPTPSPSPSPSPTQSISPSPSSMLLQSYFQSGSEETSNSSLQSSRLTPSPYNLIKNSLFPDSLYAERIRRNRIFMISSDGNCLKSFHIDENTGKLVDDAGIAPGSSWYPLGLIYVPEKSRVYVLSPGESSIRIFSSDEGDRNVYPAALHINKVDGKPDKMVYDSSSNRIFIAMEGSSPGCVESINVSDPDNMIMEGKINAHELACDPRDIVIHRLYHYLFIASGDGNMITSYDIQNNKVNGTLSVIDPVFIDLDEKLNKLFVIGGTTRKISVLDVSDPKAMKLAGDETIITSDPASVILSCQLAKDRGLLFTLESGKSGKYLRIWNVTKDPPFTEAQQRFELGSAPYDSLLYSRDLDLLFVSGLICKTRIFDCHSFPDGKIIESSQ